MKKLKGLDARKLKQFFVLNVEKIVFGVSMLLVAMLIYGSLSQEPYKKTPEELRTAIKSAQDNMQKIDKIPEKDLPGEPKFVEVASRARDEVPASGFETKNPWHFDKNHTMGTRRGEPVLFAVKDLEVTAGSGPFAFRNLDVSRRFAAQPLNPQGDPNQIMPGGGRPGQPTMPGNTGGKRPPTRTNRNGATGLQALLGERGNPEGAGIMPGDVRAMAQSTLAGSGLPRGVTATADNSIVEGMRWVCVTGLVPYRDQLAKYNEEFATAQLTDPNKDHPYWAGYLVQRAEVTTREEEKDPSLLKNKWVNVSWKDARDMSQRWAARAGDVVDPVHVDENLTFPLGPLLERNWGKEVAHTKIPLLDITQRGAGGGEVAPESAALADNIATKSDGDEFEFMRKKKISRTLVGGTGDGSMPGSRTVAPRAMPSRIPGGGMPGGEGGGGYSPRVQRYTGDGDSGASPEAPEEVEFLLFRFFDFTVEEGKRYSYRVQLVLDNPNYNLRPQYLKDAKFAKEDFIRSPMSEPSPVASVTSFNEMLAGPVTPADKLEDAKANLMIMQLDPKLGTKAVYEMRKAIAARKEKREMLPVPRGQLIQFQAKTDVVHPLTLIPEEKTIDFNANLVLLDMRGGERFVAEGFKDRTTIPGEVLFMDANGTLTSRSETTDELDYQAEAARLEQLRLAKEAKTTVPGGGLPGGEGGEGALPIRGRGAGS